ncbi:hypothetical protein Pmar_PMAR019139 [Perkinsus marinus ATCC 50983]|uniref:Uncharacterized protein n=1 Tax=Perkinsus marinus (strain ATCC 50983 / TXsc) TaxID=423536 RepID=C5KTZ2_PERM5|nr:hypothetical protein Pmar_PMAR019139 [Perkinsus marinus ATCC 50983]EER12034.1 hypothetical protein Pmar_PMAR019139 [Perkinsus marinus ATCC 50983]|eukprot:XP_002780239.1 hypothetical protein Pmar_PMAR019139 [Perkinsus marinus ATCC 50983]
MINGSSMGLYTLDIVYEDLPVVGITSAKASGENGASSPQRSRARQGRATRKANKLLSSYCVGDLFESDADIVQMRKVFTEEFFDKFRMALRNYESGEWEVAYSMFNITEQMLASEGYVDGPSASLKRYMKRYDKKAPATWSGARELP